ncbi:hypothetical protein HNP84_003583 [Thermocatellispora tengchongensis]|uniref:Uncharacterized protein n=1 Tax=Thermocatellispora tengchongensis TaxID=1073253 RepID=A0A840P9H5_9ACTN|nr:hypothetical protein [Thermocatellispora tengchongensis]MBB5133857.1 hypothetical protein [Thermocatellispora tengchongensis]
MIINTTIAPWAASACLGRVAMSAVPARYGTPAALLTVGVPAKLRQDESAHAPKYARPERAALVGGHALTVDAPAFEAMPSQPTELFANGGLRGPHPWRHPVTT